MMVLSVIVIAVVAAAYQFVPSFQAGVVDLGNDVRQILATGDVGGVGRGGSTGNRVSASSGGRTRTGDSQSTRGSGPSTNGISVYNGGPMFAQDPRTASAPTLGAPQDPP